MPGPNNIVGIARKQRVFAIREDTKGTLKYPDASTPLLVLAGFIDLNQNPAFTDSEEVQDSRDLLAQFQDMTPAGSLTLPMYVRPSGAKGTEPMGDVVFESLLGKKTKTAAASVVYSPAMEKPSFSLFALRGHTLFFSSGNVSETLKVDAQNKGAVKFDIGGSFFKMGWAGRDALQAAAVTGAAQIKVYDATKYTEGAPIQNTTKGIHGHTVTVVDRASNTLTISPVLAEDWALDDVIEPYLPAGVSVGAPLEARKTTITFGGVTKKLSSLSLSYEDSVKMLDDEMDPSGYVSEYVENSRKITGTAASHFRQNDLSLFADGRESNELPVVMLFGTDDGDKLRITMPRCKLKVPKVTTSAPVLDLSVELTALGTAGEDSIEFAWL